MKKNALKGIELSRTIGVEVEGYTGAYRDMRNNGVRHSILKHDGSLTGGSNGSQGLEVVTNPISKLDMLDEVFEDIAKYRWNVGRGTAGTHIHVDASDFYLEDKLKMAIFMQQIEKAMFLLVKRQRWSRRRGGHRNQYCRSIGSGWKELLRNLENNYTDIDWKGFKKLGDFQYKLSEMRRRYIPTPNTTRYQFVNIWASSHPTIEFRIFHSIRTSKDAKLFALLSYHIVETVKNSTLEQLEFIADYITNKSANSEDMVKRLCEGVGLDFTLKIHNEDLKSRIDYEKSRRSASTTFIAI